MSIEAMKQVIELYDKHCYNNDYGGIEFNRKHGYKFIEAINALHYPSTTRPPRLGRWLMLIGRVHH